MSLKETLRSTAKAYDADPQYYAQQWDNFTPKSADKDLVGLLAAALPQGAAILDIGSGSGRDLKRLCNLGFDPQGLDTSIGLAEIAKQYAPVTLGDMRAMPFSDDSFDGVLAAASLLHLPAADAQIALAEIRRVLRPGGWLAIGVKEGQGEIVDSAGRFFHLYRAEVLDALLVEAGFVIKHQATDIDQERQIAWLIRIAQTE